MATNNGGLGIVAAPGATFHEPVCLLCLLCLLTPTRTETLVLPISVALRNCKFESTEKEQSVEK